MILTILPVMLRALAGTEVEVEVLSCDFLHKNDNTSFTGKINML